MNWRTLANEIVQDDSSRVQIPHPFFSIGAWQSPLNPGTTTFHCGTLIWVWEHWWIPSLEPCQGCLSCVVSGKLPWEEIGVHLLAPASICYHDPLPHSKSPDCCTQSCIMLCVPSKSGLAGQLANSMGSCYPANLLHWEHCQWSGIKVAHFNDWVTAQHPTKHNNLWCRPLTAPNVSTEEPGLGSKNLCLLLGNFPDLTWLTWSPLP